MSKRSMTRRGGHGRFCGYEFVWPAGLDVPAKRVNVFRRLSTPLDLEAKIMSFYREQVLPRFQDKAMNRKSIREVRARLCGGLRGEVVEVGFGTGLNAAYYPDAGTKILAVEPPALRIRIAKRRVD